MTKVSPGKTPQVVGKLFDLRANEDFTKRILIAVATACPVEEMVEIAETMNRRRMLQPWLKARVATSSTELGTHNALGKIYTHGLFRDLARYLVKRQDLELWAKVLTKDDSAEDGGADVEKESQGRQLIDQVVELALPESESADEVSCTIARRAQSPRSTTWRRGRTGEWESSSRAGSTARSRRDRRRSSATRRPDNW